MLVLKILGVVALIISMLVGVNILNKKCLEKFQVPLFSLVTTIGILIAAGCIFIGMIWYENAIKSKGDISNGIVLLAIGGIIMLGIIIYSYWKTNFIYGSIATIIHLFLLALMMLVGIPLFLLYIVGSIALFFTSKPVYVVNK